jgi:peroxiredoxin Q/BCP
MKSNRLFKNGTFSILAMAVAFAATLLAAEAGDPPRVGGMAPNFLLNTLDDHSVELKQLAERKSVVLVVLRGWPGYQCPLCTRQVQDLIKNAAQFDERGVQVIMVYPGPADKLKAHAQEFLKDKNWPKDFLFVIDPDYTFTESYGLRWNADHETAYPSTFIIDSGNKVRFAHVSRQHGDRVDAAGVLKALGMLK